MKTDPMLQLIDIIRDINKSVSMHIDNHNSSLVDRSIQNVAQKISDHLVELEDEIRRGI